MESHMPTAFQSFIETKMFENAKKFLLMIPRNTILVIISEV